MISGRREIRILIVQTLFEHDFNDKKPNFASFIDTYNTLAKERSPQLLESDYAKNILNGIASKYEEINKIIEKAATNWTLEKIGILDRNILRLGIYEVLFGKDFEVPGCVALNEAIEISKTFLDDASKKFINGVLGAVYTEVKDPNEEKIAKKQNVKRSVGSVIYNVDKKEVKFVFVYDIFKKWTLSKGGLEDDEDTESGLKRVVKDELGIDLIPENKIGSNSYTAHPPEGSIRKEVIYYLSKTNNNELNLKEKDGISEAKWFTYEEAKKLSFYPDLKQIILNAMNKVVEKYEK